MEDGELRSELFGGTKGVLSGPMFGTVTGWFFLISLICKDTVICGHLTELFENRQLTINGNFP